MMLLPTPRNLKQVGEKQRATQPFVLEISGPKPVAPEVEWLIQQVATEQGLSNVSLGPYTEAAAVPVGDLAARESYRLRGEVSTDGEARLSLEAGALAGIRNGLATADQVFRTWRRDGQAAGFEIEDRPDYHRRGLMVSPCEGDVIAWNLNDYKELLRWMARAKLNFLILEFPGFHGRGYAFPLPKYPKAEFRNRPYRRWDTERRRIVRENYTAPNLEKEFFSEVIAYAHRLGIEVGLFFLHFYFADILEEEYPEMAEGGYFSSYRKKGHTYCYSNPEICDFFEYALDQLVSRYSDADHVILHLSENRLCNCADCRKIGGRTQKQAYITRRAYEIIRKRAPNTCIHVLDDFYIRLPDSEMKRLRESLPEDIALDWFPIYQSHRWTGIWPSLWWYAYGHTGAWAERVNLIPGPLGCEAAFNHRQGVRDGYTQARSFTGFEMNYLAVAEWTWNCSTVFDSAWLERAFETAYDLPWDRGLLELISALGAGWGFHGTFAEKTAIHQPYQIAIDNKDVPEEYKRIPDVNQLIRAVGSPGFWEAYPHETITKYAEQQTQAKHSFREYLKRTGMAEHPSLRRWYATLQRNEGVARAIALLYTADGSAPKKELLLKAIAFARKANEAAREVNTLYYMNYVDHCRAVTEEGLEDFLGMLICKQAHLTDQGENP